MLAIGLFILSGSASLAAVKCLDGTAANAVVAPADVFPSIRDQVESDTTTAAPFRATTAAVYECRSQRTIESTAVDVPIEKLPPATVKFTEKLIDTKFLADPCARGDRFCDVSRQNYRDKVVF